jgi:hypothetical protein
MTMRAFPLIAAAAFFSLLSTQAPAQNLAQATGGAARAGIAAAVRGAVQLAAVPGVRPVAKNVASGDPIFLGDQVTTGPEGRLQIMLADETVFTIGPNAALVIDQFVYDPATSAGKVTASVLKGTFRFVTGKVAKREPSDMEVKLPVGSIGVRGTSVAGETDGTRAIVVLLGPGPETNTSERVGRILVTGAGAAGQATRVEIVRPGFGTEITGVNVPPTPPVRIDPARIAAITSPLAATGPRPAAQPQQQQGQGGQPAQPGQPQEGQAQPGQPGGQAGPAPGSPPGGQEQQGQGGQPAQPGQPQEGQAQPRQPGGQAGPAPGSPPGGQAAAPPPPGGLAQKSGDLVKQSGSLAQQSGQSLALGTAGIGNVRALAPTLQQANAQVAQAVQAPPPLGRDTTFEQLRSITSGSATFTSQTFALTGSGSTGTYSITYSYNFATATATGNLQITETSGFISSNGTSGIFVLRTNPFVGGSGAVKLIESGTVSGAGGNVTINYKFGNSGNVVFKTLSSQVTYTDHGFPGTFSGSGSGTQTR